MLACSIYALESQNNRVKIDADIENAEQDQRITDQGIHKQIILETSKSPFFRIYLTLSILDFLLLRVIAVALSLIQPCGPSVCRIIGCNFLHKLLHIAASI